jgi:hypothetical protein
MTSDPRFGLTGLAMKGTNLARNVARNVPDLRGSELLTRREELQNHPHLQAK